MVSGHGYDTASGSGCQSLFLIRSGYILRPFNHGRTENGLIFKVQGKSYAVAVRQILRVPQAKAAI
jgi:hypothetical protein